MAINCARICLKRETRQQTVRFSYLLYTLSAKNCNCQLLDSRIDCFNRSQLFTRNFRTSASTFQLNPAKAPKDSFDEKEPHTTSSNQNEQILPQLEELRKRQKERLLEEPDNDEPHMIYKGILGGALKRIKLLSMTTSIAGIAMQPILIQKSGEIPLFANIAIFGFIGMFTYVTPILIHMLARKYITEIIYDPQRDTYKATTYTFFLRLREVTFRIDDVKVPEVPGAFTTITIKKSEGKYLPYFIAPEAFTIKSHYGRLMGYDKPIDLRLKENK